LQPSGKAANVLLLVLERVTTTITMQCTGIIRGNEVHLRLLSKRVNVDALREPSCWT
jgi:hypothetical protein